MVHSAYNSNMADLKTAYRAFLEEQEPSKKEEAGQELIRAIFGNDAIAENALPRLKPDRVRPLSHGNGSAPSQLLRRRPTFSRN